MNQMDLIEAPKAVAAAGFIPPARETITKDPGMERECPSAVLNALRLYRDDNDMGWEPETWFSAYQIAQMIGCMPSAAFCIAVLPQRLPFSVMDVYQALYCLVNFGAVVERRVYFGSQKPSTPGYRGYGYRYSLAGTKAEGRH